MQITLAGINHRTAPVSEREKAAISTGGLQQALQELRPFAQHAVILSTCNRTEIYTIGQADGPNCACGFLTKRLGISAGTPPPHLYTLEGTELFRHLFAVACGLDSMAIGEHEVLGQVRQALEAAEKAGMANLPLRHVFLSAIRTGRRAREETGISRNALSISSIAVNKALDIVPDISSSKIVVVGAGEAGKLSLNVARSRGAANITLVSRTEARAAELAGQAGARAASHSSLISEIQDAEIIITCAASPHPVLRARQVAQVMQSRESRPLIILDIAIPRNVDAEVRSLPGVHLYDIDDLNQDAENNRQEREKEITSVRKIIDNETSLLAGWWQAHSAQPVIRKIVDRAESIRSSQYNRAVKKLEGLSQDEKDAVELLTRSIVDKVLREPIMFLKSGRPGQDAEVIRQAFGLGEGED